MELIWMAGGAVLLLFAIVIAKLQDKQKEAIAVSLLLTGYLTLVATIV